MASGKHLPHLKPFNSCTTTYVCEQILPHLKCVAFFKQWRTRERVLMYHFALGTPIGSCWTIAWDSQEESSLDSDSEPSSSSRSLSSFQSLSKSTSSSIVMTPEKASAAQVNSSTFTKLSSSIVSGTEKHWPSNCSSLTMSDGGLRTGVAGEGWKLSPPSIPGGGASKPPRGIFACEAKADTGAIAGALGAPCIAALKAGVIGGGVIILLRVLSGWNHCIRTLSMMSLKTRIAGLIRSRLYNDVTPWVADMRRPSMAFVSPSTPNFDAQLRPVALYEWLVNFLPVWLMPESRKKAFMNAFNSGDER